MNHLKVEKKGGTVEDFDKSKVLNGLLKSGASNEEAEKISREVEVWAIEAAEEKLIPTHKIRLKVLELLKEVNSKAALAFESYQKPVTEVPS